MSASPSGFERLLVRLDADPARAGQEFERLRRTLVRFFDWRGALAPDDAADEALERLAEKLEHDVAVADIPAFAHGIARLVLHEVQRGAARQSSLDGMELPAPEQPDGWAAEEVLGHLHHCLATLPREGRDLLLAYYAGGDGTDKIEERQRLAHKWRLSPNALRSRVQRLRDRVDLCMRERCPVGEKGGDPGPRHVFPRPLT